MSGRPRGPQPTRLTGESGAPEGVGSDVDEQMRDEPQRAELRRAGQVAGQEERAVARALALDRPADGTVQEHHDQHQRHPEPEQPVADHPRRPVTVEAGIEEVARDQEEEPHEEGAVQHEGREQQRAFGRVADHPAAACDHIGLGGVLADHEADQQHPEPLHVVEPLGLRGGGEHRRAERRGVGVQDGGMCHGRSSPVRRPVGHAFARAAGADLSVGGTLPGRGAARLDLAPDTGRSAPASPAITQLALTERRSMPWPPVRARTPLAHSSPARA